MAKFFEPLRRLAQNAIDLNQNKIVSFFISNRGFQNFIISLNTVEQIFLNSEQSDGSEISSTNNTPGVYSESTFSAFGKDPSPSTKIVSGLDDNGNVIIETVSRNIGPGDPYTLFNSGFWFSTFEVKDVGDGFVIDAAPNRGATNMFNEYGQNLLGLTDDSKGRISDLLKRSMPRKILMDLREGL